MQSTPSEAALGADAPRRADHPLVPVSRVKGQTVYNREGDKLGKVEDVAIEKASGRVAYAILSFGGLLGMGERHYPVPWKLLDYDTDKRGYVIPCDKAVLENAPSFEPDDLSGWEDAHFSDNLYAYYSPFMGYPL